MSDDIIRVRELSCQSGNRFLLHDINWSVRRGEHWLVFGMNGSGKNHPAQRHCRLPLGHLGKRRGAGAAF